MPKIKNIVDHAFRFAESILTQVTQFADLYTGYYQHMIRDESSMAGILPSTSVLHIGCGAIPNTAVTLAHLTGATVTAVDNDPDAVKKAICYVKQAQMQKLVHIKKGDGVTYPAQNFGVILLSLGVEPIENVLRHIASSSDPNAKIIYRRTRYGKHSPIPPDIFSVKNQVKHHMFRIFSFTEALLLVKRAVSEKNI
jgi:2-polyprenyl-3-methyl-5-hydroxy-6-metoxy-1,4-benzoquinol methylase